MKTKRNKYTKNKYTRNKYTKKSHNKVNKKNKLKKIGGSPTPSDGQNNNGLINNDLINDMKQWFEDKSKLEKSTKETHKEMLKEQAELDRLDAALREHQLDSFNWSRAQRDYKKHQNRYNKLRGKEEDQINEDLHLSQKKNEIHAAALTLYTEMNLENPEKKANELWDKVQNDVDEALRLSANRRAARRAARMAARMAARGDTGRMWVCAFDGCDYTGTFADVVEHERTCCLNPVNENQ